VELDEVSQELYGLLPQEFTAARNDFAQQARADGRRELAEKIRALHRPALAAWASNLLVRVQQEQVEPLLQLGSRLRGAHRNLDGEELRALSRQQHQLVSALSRQAEELAADAGQPLGPQARQELAQTLQAVLTDPDAAEKWASGRLSKPLTAPVGFDAAAREAAAAPARRKSPRQKKPERPGRAESTASQDGGRARSKQREADERAKAQAREAAEEARRRRRDADAAGSDADAARGEHQEAEETYERLRGELREAERYRTEARKRRREAERRERETRRVADDAEERAQRLADAAPAGRGGASKPAEHGR
jgi:hypothetical protein